MASHTMWKLSLTCLLAFGGLSSISAQTITYIHTDVLGSPVLETNAAGTVVRQVDYRAYGEELLDGANPTPGQDRPGFTGHYRDVGTPFVYMQQRYYDPQLGKFLSGDSDPVNGSTAWNFNRYNYAANNPYANNDPDGRACNSLSGGGCGMSVAGDTPQNSTAGTAFWGVVGVATVAALGPIAWEVALAAMANPASTTVLAESAVLTGIGIGTGAEVPGSIPGAGSVSRTITVEARAAALAAEAGSNSVSARTGSGLVRYDLQGAAHYSREVSGNVPTPHVQGYGNNVIPTGPRAGEVGSVTRTGEVRPATHTDLRAAERVVRERPEIQ